MMAPTLPTHFTDDLINTSASKEKPIEPIGFASQISGCEPAGLQALYSEMSDVLRAKNDAQFNIVSKVVDNAWVRDATASLPLNQRISHKAPVIEANNTLLRCLSRLRPIDYAIGKKHNNNNTALEQKIRSEIKIELSNSTTAILTAAQGNKTDAEKLKEIKTLEKKFNTFLVKKLHEANLTSGCESSKDAQKLLTHYRNLSSLLEPARTMVTLTYDEKAKVLQRETQYPVTKKTDAQKESIKKLHLIQPYPLKEEKNGHNVRNIASQEADGLFVDLMSKDDRALPAQARKTHVVGAKNAFIVKIELIPVRAI